ncbi:MAG: hypothetical protein GX677_04080 [Treponema sp.]|nr:hypothetical protein [Treponema sp.]
MKKLTIITIFALSILFASFATVKEIPEDLTVNQLIQKGQSEYDLGHYTAAETYFSVAIQRFGTNDAVYVEAKYELGHLYIKTKDYKNAYSALTEIINIFNYSPSSEIPTSYKKLALIELNKIPRNIKESLEKN